MWLSLPPPHSPLSPVTSISPFQLAPSHEPKSAHMYLPSQNKQTNKKGISQKQNKGSPLWILPIHLEISFSLCPSTLSSLKELYISTSSLSHSPFILKPTAVWLLSGISWDTPLAKITNSNRLAMSQSLPGWLSPGHPAPLMTHFLSSGGSLVPCPQGPHFSCCISLTLCPTHCSSSSILPLNSSEPQISITRPFLLPVKAVNSKICYALFKLSPHPSSHRCSIDTSNSMWPERLYLFIDHACGILRRFPSGSDDKESTCNAGNVGSIPGWERTPGEGNGNLLQYSCLENPMNRRAWGTTVHGVTTERLGT